MSKKIFIKRIFAATFFAAGIFLNFNFANAYEIFWSDPAVKFTRIVLYPLNNIGQNSRYEHNSYIYDRMFKKFKKKPLFIALTDRIHEHGDMNKNNFGSLLQNFPDEKSRAAEVEKVTMADAYIIPRFRENRVQKDISPQRTWNVQLKTWTRIEDGPNGNETKDEKTRTVQHTIPAREIFLHRMSVEFAGYDANAKRVLTSIQNSRLYDVTEEKQFKDLVNDFQKVFAESKKIKKTSGKIKIGFKPTPIFDNDVFKSTAADYSFYVEAAKRIKNAQLIADTNSSASANYYLTSQLTRFDLVPVWHEPTYSIYDNIVKSEKRKWYNKDGEEKEMKIYYYDQSINDHYAYWSFYWRIGVNFALITPQNSVVMSQSYLETDDKPMDAYRHAATDFCKKVASRFK